MYIVKIVETYKMPAASDVALTSPPRIHKSFMTTQFAGSEPTSEHLGKFGLLTFKPKSSIMYAAVME